MEIDTAIKLAVAIVSIVNVGALFLMYVIRSENRTVIQAVDQLKGEDAKLGRAVRDMGANYDHLSRRMTEMEILVAGKYKTRAEIDASERVHALALEKIQQQIQDGFEKVYARLDSKADK